MSSTDRPEVTCARFAVFLLFHDPGKQVSALPTRRLGTVRAACAGQTMQQKMLKPDDILAAIGPPLS
jgi:hypothetical protein